MCRGFRCNAFRVQCIPCAALLEYSTPEAQHSRDAFAAPISSPSTWRTVPHWMRSVSTSGNYSGALSQVTRVLSPARPGCTHGSRLEPLHPARHSSLDAARPDFRQLFRRLVPGAPCPESSAQAAVTVPVSSRSTRRAAPHWMRPVSTSGNFSCALPSTQQRAVAIDLWCSPVSRNTPHPPPFEI